MGIKESGEMYLETIYILSKEAENTRAMRKVRSLDVAQCMGYSKPSVSRAVGLLKKGGYVDTDKDGFLLLTDKGKEIAAKTYHRHTLLTEFFTLLGVPEEIACEDACKIEHDISDEAFSALEKHVNKLRP